MTIAWRVEVPQNEHLPRGYGVAFYRYDADAVVAMPVPLNLIVGGWRALVTWLRFPPWRRYAWRIEHVRRTAYQDGLEDGRRRRWFDEMTS
jgi:hypothetical protein